VLDELVVNTDIRAVALYGGVGKRAQIEALEAGCEILVSTPGRFLDLYSFGHISLKQMKTLILDEADRLMDMGFLNQLRSILEVIPTKRQNLLFTATFPDRLEAVSAEFLEFPVRIEGTASEKPVDEVEQAWLEIPNFRTKLQVLLHYLKDPDWSRIMIFCRTKDSAERVFRFLERKEVGEVRVLHANKGQNTRIHALDDFRAGNTRILVTTDVTSRGIDVEHVTHVVNFEIPANPQDYLHRIGRTARIHRTGMAISLADPAEIHHIKEINKYLQSPVAQIQMPEEVQAQPDLPGERREMLRRIDLRKQKADPTYKGAFQKRRKKR
jgi:ATP-dependent RNA helicase RhlE